MAKMPAHLWARHDHGSMDMGDAMSIGTIDVTWFPKLYWIFIGSVIGAFTFVNVIDQVILRHRLFAASKSDTGAARPKSYLSQMHATVTAVLREVSNASTPPIRFKETQFFQPTVGALLLVLGNALLLMALCFYALSPSSFSDFENTAYRAGFLSLAQVPLIFLLAGKKNVIGWLTGSSYERLNWLHRWVARTLLLTVTLHMAFWFRSWAPYEYIGHQFKTDRTTQTGFSTWCVLLWIVLSSFAPIRSWSYEVFIIQHFVSMVAFVTLLFLHLPSGDWGWLWAPVAIYLFDRTVRAVSAAYINLYLFHLSARKAHGAKGLLTCEAQLTPLRQGVTKITISTPPVSWQAGQHAFLSCHSIIPFQSHPFTISSLPEDGKMEFFVQSRSGATKSFLDHARQTNLNLPSAEDTLTPLKSSVTVEGPYGRMRPLRQFDSLVLIAGSTGATFTLPLLRDLVQHWNGAPHNDNTQHFWALPCGAVTRHVSFNWVVKSRDQLLWFANELADVVENVELLQSQGKNVSIDIHAYITCDEAFTVDFEEKPKPPVTSGNAQLRSNSFSSSLPPNEEKELKAINESVKVRQIDSRLESSSSEASPERTVKNRLKTCQPDGTCCCRTSITSSSDSGNAQVVCTCNGCSHDATEPTSCSASSTGSTAKHGLHPDVKLRSGRPTPRHLLLPTLEAAQGETAVVACGPRGLNEEIRRATVALSDERAVHKGTGAQAIWFHGEGFGY